MRTRVLIIPPLFCVLLAGAGACTKTKDNTNGAAGNNGYAGQTTNPADSGSPDRTDGSAEGDSSKVVNRDGGPSNTDDGSTVNKSDAGNNSGGGGGAAGNAGSAGVAGGAIAGGGSGGTGGAAGVSTDCCVEHSSNGCDNATIQQCICDKLPDCCAKGWTQPCVLLTEGHYCEPKVRDCVCGPEADGGWEQVTCCSENWTNFCETVASKKCNPTISGCSN